MTYQVSSPGSVSPDLVLTTSAIITTKNDESSFKEDFFLPSDHPLDKEICDNIYNRILNKLCELDPEIAKTIDKTPIYNCLNTCVNEELNNRLLINDPDTGYTYGLRDLLIAAANAENDSLEFFHFAGSSVVYKLSDAIIEALHSSEKAKDIITKLFKSNLKRKPHDSDWKVVINESKDPSVSFWNNVECHVRAILRDFSKVKCGKILGDSFDIIAECVALRIEYEISFGKFFRLCFREHGIELAIGSFHGKLFKDTVPEIVIKKKSVTKDPRTLQTALSEDGVDIIQAGIFRGYNVISTDKPETKNDRAGIQYIRRSLNRDTCFSEIDYPTFIQTLFKSYPVSPKWPADIAKKFSNINKGHSNDPVDYIVWGLFIFLCSLKHFPEYKVDLLEEEKIWKALPFQCYQKEKNKQVLFKQHPFYLFMRNSQLPCTVVEGIFGIAGLLTLSLVEKGTKTAYSIGRHNGEKKPVLYFEHSGFYIAIEPDLLSFCTSLKERCADVWGYHSSEQSEILLKLFLDSTNIPSQTMGTDWIIKNHARFLPQTASEAVEIAYTFLLAPDPFLNVIGASVLMSARVYHIEAVDEALISYALPLLLSSNREDIQTFGEMLTKRFFLGFQLKDIPSYMHPKTGMFSLPHWLNAITLTGHSRCCQIASEHWVANVPLENSYFLAYFTFMENLWRIEPLCLIKVWSALIPHAFEGQQALKLFSKYAERIIQLPENTPALIILEPFVLFTNTCLEHISTQEDKDKLFQLVGKIASLQPQLLPHCLPWLHLLPIDVLPTFQLGSISAILHHKMHEAKTYAEKRAVYEFFIKNLRIPDVFELFFDSKFIAFFKAIDLLDDVYEKYIQEPSISPRRKVHIASKLLSNNPAKALSNEKEIIEAVKSLVKEKKLSYALLLKVFRQCLNCGPKHFFLLKQLCKFTVRLLNDKLHPLIPVAELFNEIHLTPAFTQVFLLFRLLERIVFEHTKKSFNTAINLVNKIRDLASFPTSNWENLIQAMRLASHHLNTKESYESVRTLTSSLKLENAFHQADLDLLTFAVSQKQDISLDNLLIAIASKKYLDKSLISQLKSALQLHLDNILIKKPLQALSLIKHKAFSEIFDQTERFQYACAVFVQPDCFDEDLFKMILSQLDAVKEPSENIIAFSNYLLQSKYLYHQCLDIPQKTERLISFTNLYTNSSMQFWDNAALKLMDELIIQKEYSLCLDVLEKCSFVDQNMIELITSLIQKTAQSHYLVKRIFKIALKIDSQLSVLTWDALGVAALELNDSHLKKDLILRWQKHLSSLNIQDLINRNEAEKKIHFQMLLFSIHESSPLTIYFEHHDLIPHLLSCAPSTSQKSLVLSHFLNHLIVNSPSQGELIEQGINDLIQWEGCLLLSIKTLCLWIDTLDVQNPVVDTYFQKIINHSDINTTFIFYKWNTTAETKTISGCIKKLLSRQEKPSNLLQFIYFICPAFSQDNPIWLGILKAVVDFYINDNIHYQTLSADMVGLLAGFFSLFQDNPPEKLLSEYTQYFHSQAFQIFLLNIKIFPKDVLQGLLHCCHKKKLMPERTIAECAYLVTSYQLDDCLKEPVENLFIEQIEGAFLFYVENVPLFLHFPEFDVLCLEKYIQLLSKILQEKIETDNFQSYVDSMLLKRHPIIDNSLIRVNAKGLIMTQIKLMEMMFNHAINLNKRYYKILFKTISGLISACITNLKKETNVEEILQRLKKNIIKFILFPRNQDSVLNHKFFSIANALLLQIKSSLLYVGDSSIEALSLYVRILDKNRKSPPSPEHVKIVLELTLAYAPYNYFEFAADLLSSYKDFFIKQECRDKISICKTLLINACKANIPLPLRYVLLRNLWEIVYINGLLRPEKHENETDKIESIDLGFSLVEKLTEVTRHLYPLSMNEIMKEIKAFFEGYLFAHNTSNFQPLFVTKSSLTFNSTFFHTYFVSNFLRSVDERNCLDLWDRYFALMRNFIRSIPDDLDHYMEVETNNLELLPSACNLTESSPWSCCKDDRVQEQRKILAIQTYELRLQCYVAKTFPIQDLRSSFLQKSSALNDILLFYRHFNPKNYRYIVSLICDFKNPHEDIQRALALVKTYSSEGNRSGKNRIDYFYALIHCYELAKALGSIFRGPFETLLDIIETSIQEELKTDNWFIAYQLLYKALKINIVPLTDNWQQLQYQLLSTLLKQTKITPHETNLEIIQRYFPKLMDIYIRTRWLAAPIMKKEKNEIIFQSLKTIYQADIHSFDISGRGKAIVAYLKNQWKQGKFENQEWLITLLKNELPLEENVGVWAIAAEMASKNPSTLNWAIRFSNSLIQANHIALHKHLIGSIIAGFLLQKKIPASQMEECLNALTAHKAIPLLSGNGVFLSNALRMFILNHFSILQQNSTRCATLLNYYISSMIDLLLSDQCSNEFLQQKIFVDTLQKLSLIGPNKIAKDCAQSFIINLQLQNKFQLEQENIPQLEKQKKSKLISKLIVEFYCLCQGYSNLKTIIFIDDTEFLQLFSYYCETVPDLQQTCQTLISLYSLYTWQKPEIKRLVLSQCLKMTSSLLEKGYQEDTLPLFALYQPILKDISQDLWEERWTIQLAWIFSFFKEMNAWENAYIVFSTLSKRSTYFDQKGKLEFYYSILSEGNVILASKIAFEHNLIKLIDADILLKGLFSSPPSEDNFQHIIQLYAQKSIKDIEPLTRYSLSLTLSKDNLNSLVSFLDQLESDKDLPPPAIRKQAWLCALLTLYKNNLGYPIQCFNNNNLTTLLNEIPDTQEKERFNALLTLAILKVAPFPNQMSMIGHLWPKLSHQAQSSKLIGEVYEQLKTLVKTLDNQIHLCQCLELLSKHLPEDPSEAQSFLIIETINSSIETLLENSKKQLTEKMEKHFGELIKRLKIEKKLALYKTLLDTKIPSLTQFTIRGLNFYLDRKISPKNKQEELKAQLILVAFSLPNYIESQKLKICLTHTFEVLGKIEALNVLPKDQILCSWNNLFIKTFEALPASSFTKDFPVYCELMKNNYNKTIPHGILFKKLFKSMCESFAEKAVSNEKLRAYLPEFIKTILNEFKLVSHKIDKADSSKTLHTKIWDLGHSARHLLAFSYLSKKASEMNYKSIEAKKNFIQWIIKSFTSYPLITFEDSIGDKNKIIIITKKINLSLNVLLEIILHWYEPSLSAFFTSKLTPIVNGELTKANFIDIDLYQLHLIMFSDHAIPSEQLLKAEKNHKQHIQSAITKLVEKWLKTKSSDTIQHILKFLINYQNHSGLFEPGTQQLTQLLKSILKTIWESSSRFNYSKGSADSFYEFLELLFKKNNTSELAPDPNFEGHFFQKLIKVLKSLRAEIQLQNFAETKSNNLHLAYEELLNMLVQIISNFHMETIYEPSDIEAIFAAYSTLLCKDLEPHIDPKKPNNYANTGLNVLMTNLKRAKALGFQSVSDLESALNFNGSFNDAITNIEKATELGLQTVSDLQAASTIIIESELKFDVPYKPTVFYKS